MNKSEMLLTKTLTYKEEVIISFEELLLKAGFTEEQIKTIELEWPQYSNNGTNPVIYYWVNNSYYSAPRRVKMTVVKELPASLVDSFELPTHQP